MADVLPGYQYQPNTARYRNAQTGRFVSRSDINGLLRDQTQGAESRMRNLATVYYEKRIAPASFVDQMRTEQRRLTLQNQALAKGGMDRLDYSDYGRAGASLRQQYQAIIGTAQDVLDDKVSLPQLLNRMNRHAGEGRRIYNQTVSENLPDAPEGMTTIERRVLADAQHCQDCLNYYDQGWQLVGILPEPGEECQCETNCRCEKIRRDVPTAELDQWIGTKR